MLEKGNQNMKKRRMYGKIFVTIILLLISAIGFNVYGGEKRVLIASQSSDFKNSIVKLLQEEMKDSGIQFTVEDVSALGKVKEGEWHAIVIVHAVKMGKINKRVKRYLDSVDDFSKVIVLTTYGNRDPVPHMYGIDSISAASKKEQVQTLTSYLKNRLQAILSIGS
jgi:hypothetical protein